MVVVAQQEWQRDGGNGDGSGSELTGSRRRRQSKGARIVRKEAGQWRWHEECEGKLRMTGEGWGWRCIDDRRWRRRLTKAKRQKGGRGSEEDDKRHRVMHTGRRGNSPTTRSSTEVVTDFGDEGGDGRSGTLERREGGHLKECGEENSKVVRARAEDHG